MMCFSQLCVSRLHCIIHRVARLFKVSHMQVCAKSSYRLNRELAERVLRAPAGAQVGGKPDFADPVVLSADRGGTSVESLCNQIQRRSPLTSSYALVWGTSSKHYPQRCARAAGL